MTNPFPLNNSLTMPAGSSIYLEESGENGSDSYAVRSQRHSSIDSSLAVVGPESLELPDPLFFALARSVEERDSSLGRHCERLALMSSIMGLMIGLSTESISTLHTGGYLHDIGKIALPDSILLKPAPLDDNEWKIMKTHPERGEKICSGVPSLRAVLPLIRHHHEHWNGSGYPDRLKGEEIPLLARVLQLADIYDALTSVRPYKRAFSPGEALAIIRDETRKGLRDPNLFPVLEAAIPTFASDSFWEMASLSLSALAASLSHYGSLVSERRA